MASPISMDGKLTIAISSAVEGLKLDCPENSSGYWKYTCTVCKEGTACVYSCQRAKCQCKAFGQLLQYAKDNAEKHWWVCPKAVQALFSSVESFLREKALQAQKEAEEAEDDYEDNGYDGRPDTDDYDYDYSDGSLSCGCVETCRGRCEVAHGRCQCGCGEPYTEPPHYWT
jgi:hypothetical protein